jgi:glycosyltransferase involved in cell wall biosynthesis
MLKVCLALPVFYPTFAGGPLRFLRYQPGLRKRDVYSRVFAGTPRHKDDFHPIEPPDDPLGGPTSKSAGARNSAIHTVSIGQMLPIEEIEGLPVHRVRLPTKTGIHRTSRYFRALIRLCQNPETRPDVIQLHSFERLESLYWLWRLRRLDIPLVYASQIARPIRRFRRWGKLARWLHRTMLRVFYNSFDGIVTNSAKISDRIRSLGVDTPIAVISNGVDLERYHSCRDRTERLQARRALGVSGPGPIILSVGAICPRKGSDLLIEAWTKILQQHPDAELVLVGPRHDLNNPNLLGFRSKIEKLIAESRHPERVHLLGVRNEMNEVYAAADLVVLASSREGMPNAVLEAMACERPVVLTPVLGQTRAIGRPGVEFEESDRSPAALAEAIGRLLTDPDRCCDLIRRGRNWVEENLDVEQSLDQLALFYRRAADRTLCHATPPLPGEKILFVTDRKFWRRSIGSETRIATLVLHLARTGFPISVAYLGRLHGVDRHQAQRFASAERNLGIIGRKTARFQFRPAVQTLRRFARRIARPRTGDPEPALSFASDSTDEFEQGSPARREFVQQLLRETRPNVVIVEFLRLTHTVYPRAELRPDEKGRPGKDAAGRSPLYWIDTHDVMHERTDRYRIAEQAIPNALTAQQETRMLATYDAIIAIQAREAALFRELLPDQEILVVPHGVDAAESLTDCRRSLGSQPTRPIRLGFLGGRDLSNRHSLDWFVETVWPELHSRFANRVELHVAGQVCQNWRSTAPGIACQGPVASAERFWSQIDIAVNPVQFGSGLKIKNVEALAFGCALLTTPIGAEGLEAASPDGLGIATTEEEWQALLVHWLTDPEIMARVGRHGRAYADAHLTEDIAFAELRSLLVKASTERVA